MEKNVETYEEAKIVHYESALNHRDKHKKVDFINKLRIGFALGIGAGIIGALSTISSNYELFIPIAIAPALAAIFNYLNTKRIRKQMLDQTFFDKHNIPEETVIKNANIILQKKEDEERKKGIAK